ncbi:MAG TPA: TerB family tellurite resistance protein [Cyclobacteriaceae bacterium]
MANIVLSPTALSVFGCIEVSEEAITNYGYAMLAVAGADHLISEKEMEWLDTYFCELFFIPDSIKEKYKAFDFKSVNLDEILPRINFDTAVNTKLLLVYHSVNMATADEYYHRKEQMALASAAKILNISRYHVRAIEQLSWLERSLTEMRKAIFEVDYEGKVAVMPNEKDKIRLNVWVTKYFGHSFTTYDSLQNYYRLIMSICGSDGNISEAEIDWLEMTALMAGTPPEIIESLRAFDYRNRDVSEFITNIVTDVHQNFERISLYLAMYMCRADGVYADEEKRTIRDAAHLLNVDQEVIDYLENLVEMEISVDRFRLRILR